VGGRSFGSSSARLRERHASKSAEVRRVTLIDRQIGLYQVFERIGEGAMGEVYLDRPLARG
jgi:hypothetical protein